MSEARTVADSAATIDPVTAEVVRSAMETVCFEMATHVSRTATTPILNQSNERNATILDAKGRLAALSVGIPQFMLSSTLPVQYALELFGDDATDEDAFAVLGRGDFPVRVESRRARAERGAAFRTHARWRVAGHAGVARLIERLSRSSE